MKVAMKILVFVSIVLVCNVFMAQGTERSRESFSNEWSFSSESSSRNNRSFGMVCEICRSLCLLPTTQDVVDSTENGAPTDGAEMGTITGPLKCYLCTNHIDETGRFTCGHNYSQDYDPENATSGFCPPCRLYKAVRGGDLDEVQAMLIICAPVLNNVVFLHGVGKKSLLHVAAEAAQEARQLVIIINIMFALIAENKVGARRIVSIAHGACCHRDGFYWKAFCFSLPEVAQCTDSELIKTLSSFLSQMEMLQAVAGGFRTAKNAVARVFSGAKNRRTSSQI